MDDTTHYFVEGWGTGLRLDVYLTKAGLVPSRSKARQFIDAGLVVLDEKQVSAHVLLKEGQKFTILPVPSKIEDGAKELIPDISVIHEDDNYLIIDKPSGLVVHGGRGIKGATLADALLNKYPELQDVGDPSRPGIVHRLDKDVSGLMIIPRTPDSFSYFQELFQERRIEKIYTALVHGRVKEDEGEITFKIARSKRTGRMAARPVGQEGKEALTRYVVKERFPHATLLSVQIVTGRTHQIRAHFFALGHAIVGDKRYPARKKGSIKLARPFLHASELKFVDPRGVERSFASSLSSELLELLEGLRKKYSKI